MPASSSVPGPELLLTPARKNGKKKRGVGRGGEKNPKLPPLTCARQPRRARQPYTPGRTNNTHTSASIHSDAARRILLDVTAGSRVIPHLQFLRFCGENRSKFTTKSRCGAHARNCAPRGEASSVWEQQDRREVKMLSSNREPASCFRGEL